VTHSALSRADLAGRAEAVAPLLLGAVLESRGPQALSDPVAVRITEVEAYGSTGADPASHAHRGRTQRNAAMFGEPGHLYMYFIYGMHWCANVVCGQPDEGAAVLIRAGEVLRGVEVARLRRGGSRPDRDLARGPANLAAGLGLRGQHNDIDLFADDSPVRLLPGPRGPLSPAEVACGPRVGIRHAVDRPWRWWIVDDPTVSRHPGPRGHRPR